MTQSFLCLSVNDELTISWIDLHFVAYTSIDHWGPMTTAVGPTTTNGGPTPSLIFYVTTERIRRLFRDFFGEGGILCMCRFATDTVLRR